MSRIKPDGHNIKPFRKDSRKPAPRERKPPKKITADYLHNAGLYYLQRFAASSGHFRRVMMRKIDRSCAFYVDQDKEACKSLLNALVEKFQRSGLLDDETYLKASMTSLRRRGLSSRAITAKLSAKSVGQEQIRTALLREQEGSQNVDLRAALRLARRKRIGPFAKSELDESQQTKAMAAMGRAGFDYETTRRALAYGLDEAEELLGI